MSSNAFQTALANTKASKNLDTLLVGNASSYLDEGTHEVTITATGPSTTRDGAEIPTQVALTYSGEGDKVFNDRAYLTSQDESELSFAVRQLLSALIPDTALWDQWMDLALIEGPAAFAVFTGMKLRITLSPGKGYQVRSTGNGKFKAVELDNKGKVVGDASGEYDDVKEVKDAATAAGFFRSYLKIRKAECTHSEANAAAFAIAVVGRSKPKITVNKVAKAV